MSADALDAVVVPGGWAPDKLRRYDAIKDLVAKAYHQGKFVGLTCHAGLVGISAGIVDGKRATGRPRHRDPSGPARLTPIEGAPA